MNKFKEKILLFKAKNKDPEAYGEIYDFYAEKIYRFIFFKVSSVQEAEDLTSDVFLKSWQYIIDKGKGETIENLNAFLYKVARNTVIDHYRKRSKEAVKESEFEYDIITSIRDEKIDLEEQAIINSDMQEIEKALKELKEEYRELITLRYLNELTINEIAQILEKSSGTVRVTLFRATRTLKDLLENKQETEQEPVKVKSQAEKIKKGTKKKNG